MPETTETGYVIPTVSEALADAQASLREHLPATDDPSIPLTLPNAVANVLALMSVVANRHVAKALRETSPETATREGLIRLGARRGVGPFDATRWTGSATFTGVNTTEVSVGTEFTRSDGALYRTTELGTVSAGECTVDAESADYGASYNMDADTECRLSTLVSGLDSVVTIASSNDDGADAEATEPFRARVLYAYAKEPWGGSNSDWVRWVSDIQENIDRVFPQNNYFGIASLRILFTVAPSYSEGVREPDSVIPTEGDVDAVQTALTTDPLAVLGIEVFVQAPEPYAVDAEIDVYPKPVSNDVKNAIRASIDTYLDTLGAGGVLRNSQYRAAVQRGIDAESTSDAYFVLVSLAGGSAAQDIELNDSQLFIRGDITWTA